MRQSVLNREQQKVLELLKEIDIICRKNKITYFLSPYLTLCAVTERPFPLNPEAGVIYMKTGDMERFKNVFEEEPVLRRALESMDSYKYFPGFYLRYTDKDTLFYKMDDYGKFQYPGMAVRILPLQCEYGPRRKYLWNIDGEESTKEKKSGEIRELLPVSVWYVCLCSVEEDGSVRGYFGI